MPVLLFIAYLLFHFHLQRLWDAVIELPAIFPDGHTLGDRGPGIITGLLRTHFRWMNPDPSSTRLVEKGVSLLVAYWIVPPTLLLFWARYLTRQEIHGTILQALLVTIATGIAAYATTKVGRPQERWAFEKKWAQRCIRKLKAISPYFGGDGVRHRAAAAFRRDDCRSAARAQPRATVRGGQHSKMGAERILVAGVRSLRRFDGGGDFAAGRQTGAVADDQVTRGRWSAIKQREIPVRAGLRRVFRELPICGARISRERSFPRRTCAAQTWGRATCSMR